MVLDTRPAEEIASDVHAVADLARLRRRRHRPDHRLVRGIDRFGYTVTREPAAVVWVDNRHGGGHHAVLVPLSRISIYQGRTR